MTSRITALAARFALALPTLLLAGCSAERTGGLAPVTVERASAVMVRDSLGAVVFGATVFAIRLDAPVVVLGLTDGSGIAHFTLAEGRWAVSTSVSPATGPVQAAGGTGEVRGRASGVPDTVLFRLRLAPQSVAFGNVTLAGRLDHSGTIVSIVELPGLSSTDVRGAWHLAALPPGLWTGSATHAGFKVGVFDVIVPAPADTIALGAPTVLQPGTGAPSPK
jgi:hypothetical protein